MSDTSETATSAEGGSTMPAAHLERVTGPTARISTYTTNELVTISSGATVREAAQLIDSASVGCVLVGSMEAVEGIVSERDIVRFIGIGGDPDATLVGDLESKHLMYTPCDTTVADVAEEMMENYVRHVVVTEGEQVVGIVSMRDVISAYLT
jgi:CBS domain-containing protein